MKVRIKQAAAVLGVTPETLRRWEVGGKIQAERTKGGHRLYDLATVQGRPQAKSERATIAYARVSSHEQKPDLVRQVERLELYCTAQGWKYEIIQDLGSGMNYRKKGLAQLLKRLCYGEMGRLVLTHKDRLLRFGSELIFTLCEIFSTEVVIINASEEATFEEELAGDVLEILTVFSARLYGSRSHKNKKIVEKLQEAADEVCR